VRASLSSCSHILRTRQPSAVRSLFTFLSRSRLPRNFFLQKSAFVAGMFPHLRQQCQKQPSMKIATRDFVKAKSGRPVRGRWRRQPQMRFRLRSEAKSSSVSRLFRDRIRDITSDRLRRLNTSVIARCYAVWSSYCTLTRSGSERRSSCAGFSNALTICAARRAIRGTTTEFPNCR